MGDGGADVPAGERHHLDVQLAENYNKDLKEGEKLSIDRWQFLRLMRTLRRKKTTDMETKRNAIVENSLNN